MQLWAKLTDHEKFVVYGALAAAVGALIGLILATSQVCVTYLNQSVCGGSINYFTAENAGLFGLLTLVAAIATLVVVYLHVAPNMNITWPMPYTQIVLIVAGATAACAILTVLMQLIRAGGFGPQPPITMYIADILIVAGGAFAAYIAYLDWNASKA